MERLEALGNSLSQITLYDIKSYYEQAKNVVLNVSEIEAKVREATNDDPWGASSTLMQDIASRTFNYPEFNEIMPSIYSRFMEKEARQWRQIYKSLQLLEYLIKNGSERVVDDARAHISTIKMLRNFHYIDDKGKDQGINVRNRSKEIVELLSDVENIRTERRKAKANRSKYIGTGSDGMSSSGGGGRYGGFGSDSLGYNGGGSSSYNSGDRYGYGDRSSGPYGGGGGGGGGGSSSFRDSGSRGFEEYNAGDDEVVATSPTRNSTISTSPPSARLAPARKSTAIEPAPAPIPEVDLLGGLDDDTFSSGNTTKPPPAFAEKALPVVTTAPVQNSVGIDDDDFADFQAAPVTAPATGASSHTAPAHKMNIMEMPNSTPARPQSMSFAQPQAPIMQTRGSAFGSGMGMGGMPSGAIHRPSPSLSSNNSFSGAALMRPMSTMSTSSSGLSTNRAASVASSKPASSANFDDLWSMSLGSKPSTPTANTPVGSKSIKDIQNEKASAGLWASGSAKPPQPAMGSNAFGSFGSSGGATNSGGGDDLLL
ncbi:hypothetical protein J3R30DRAFT_3460099 [Lentinula aciculospora]|uniref:ENTH domain-containing protein n=1 Tax=Lentinula aciculospora TaxID=153920 RepID=A0A9W9AGX7_9AGAR|nr:hypothetical protein J3R30DRAFT_3460099 [Lentinula aciculospora]